MVVWLCRQGGLCACRTRFFQTSVSYQDLLGLGLWFICRGAGDGEQSAGSRRIEAFDLHTLNLFEIALKLRGDAGNLLPFPVGPVDEAEISAGKRFLEPAGRNGTAAVLVCAQRAPW